MENRGKIMLLSCTIRTNSFLQHNILNMLYNQYFLLYKYTDYAFYKPVFYYVFLNVLCILSLKNNQFCGNHQ